MTDKPILNYVKEDGTMISFRESLKAYAPTPEEEKTLKISISAILGKETTPEFDDTINYLITFLRENLYINTIRTSATTKRKRLEHFKKKLDNLITLMEEDVFENIQLDLMHELTTRMSENKEQVDILFSLYNHAKTVSTMCKTVDQQLKGNKPSFTPNSMRQILAEELARELYKIGEKPKKYRDSSYFQILRLILKMIPYTRNEQKLFISIPDDLFKIANDAIDAYPNKEPFSLLAFD